MVLRRAVLWCLILLCTFQNPAWARYQDPPEAGTPLFDYPSNHGFIHETGYHVPYGWASLYRIHQPGYFIRGRVNGGDPLPEGTFRYIFRWALLPGSLAGLFHGANDIIRVEVWDVTAGECLMSRIFQLADLESSHYAVAKSLTFSTLHRLNHRFEPRVYWPGLSGVFLQSVELRRLEDISPKALADKAQQFELDMGHLYLDRGYVVVRTFNGEADDVGDAGMWTGLYAATEAWRYRSSHSPEALARMQDSLRALHELHAQSPVPGTLIRYIYPDGTLYPDSASKDTYTGFFFAVAQCLPLVKDRTLRKELLQDVQALGDHFLDHDLRFVPAVGQPLDLNPYISPDIVREYIRELMRNDESRKNLIGTLKTIRFYFLSHGQQPWPELTRMLHALKTRDGEKLESGMLPFVNGSLRALKQLQRNVSRSARVNRYAEQGPYGKLNLLLNQALNQILASRPDKKFQRLEDVKVLSSQSLHALHLLKIAAEVLPKPNRFDDYYRENLWKNKELLKTAMEWNNFDEEAMESLMGDARAGVMRTTNSHLSFLALYDLIQEEKDPSIHFDYQQLFSRQYQPVQADYNAFLHVMGPVVGLAPDQTGVGFWSLMLYPTDRRGRGETYWRASHTRLAAAYGGDVSGQARDPVPVFDRPRDPFMWQRISRSLRGDNEQWLYPPLDYLFVYWMARDRHEINDSSFTD